MPRPALAALPSVDRLLSTEISAGLITRYGRVRVTDAIRNVLSEQRSREPINLITDPGQLLASVADALSHSDAPSLRPVLNLTGTVLHTNLGRAALPEAAIARVMEVARGASNLEFDIDAGQRGDRDRHIEPLLVEITGAEAATVVNNNAAAVMLTLNTLANNREVPVSRGELVEIGGSFRIPDIMARAGCYLVEVGTTNRTHAADYARALGEHSGLIMKVHTSNYEVQGFTHSVPETELAAIAHERNLPFVIDLGSGTLVDLTRYGLPGEPTVQQSLAAGADLVTFSGDKLLGGPQAGIIAGRADLVEQIRRNPMKRALRVDKMTMAALFEVLSLYRNPDRLVEQLPTLRLLARPLHDIEAIAAVVEPRLAEALSGMATTRIEAAFSQIGSGALPTSLLPSCAVVITPTVSGEAALQKIAGAFRALAVPVIGRLSDGELMFDLRTLEHADGLVGQLDQLKPS